MVYKKCCKNSVKANWNKKLIDKNKAMPNGNHPVKVTD